MRQARIFVVLSTSFLLISCANPGPPKPPSLHLPALVSDLTAERVGDHVTLRWTTPSQTTDGLPIKGTMTAQICREAGPRPGTPVARLAACAPILRLAVVPGPSEVADRLSSTLASGTPVLLTYRIQILNSVERSAGDSSVAAFAASGPAPLPLEAFNVSASEHGAVLQWTPQAKASSDQIEFTRTDLSTTPPSPKTQKIYKSAPIGKNRPPANAESAPKFPAQVHLRTPDVIGSSLAGTVDSTAAFGATYTYVADRVRSASIGSHPLEIHSESSAPVTIALRDVFPPRSPVGLATVPGTGAAALNRPVAVYIDLSWEPNTESDLAGYFVYRQFAGPKGDPEGPSARLTPSPIATLAYRDVAVSPGRRYIYWVTAVDASGNESAPSAKAQEAVTPE